MPAEVDTMVSVREVPWHGLGKIVSEQLTAADCIREAGLPWKVIREPLQIARTGAEVPKRFANVREDNGEVLGIVGSTYTILQNEDAFGFADSLVDDGSAKYETAGSLRGGKTIWLMMNLPTSVTIAGVDEVKVYLALRNSHEGSSQGTVMITPVRIVCQNTLNLALGSARRSWSFRHTGDLEGKLAEARQALGLTFEYLEEFETVSNHLAEERCSDDAFERIVEQLTDVERHAAGMIATFQESPNLEHVRNTKWAALNAVGEYWEHGRDTRSQEKVLRDTLSGGIMRQRDKALALLTS